ncbi:bifunctional diaminohydroxyphosphoribosylaminopyrimidine deaminase/5-amino-6-(5-phosphoribosylamino)uracil reductase RibD [uncultured Flavonifractor sp.]|uniref:bifunctional diaminohydroxyphosphoribosylaminopyrimidine deaminase/5-amino-6-(5-phosphoribosylamino)uracil reductase RibD n=1 Tax=uncultured Flavonifractor sp. TaxID=1193534 RepID=UPI002612520E|nr:bifunctional diaminohydroxyphosphoribosylaminopyrimidine deaminase/5-amino-6-(5-phosphoribosylamino)uracil reductase RibD [uncultured Flavonifractor sp.]
MEDREYMALALSLAERGVGWASPNPMVGAVVVKDGRIIGQGWHEKCGQPHAERNALAACTQDPGGATLYVTLEPCCHQGRQPPCTQAILEAGIRRVVVGSGDPNPLVAGKGIAQLRAQGVEVTQHVLEEDCDRLNQVFFHYIRTRRPYVVMKYAMTLDGKIAARTGDSQWVTGEAARNHVQQLRHRYTGILVGVGTVLADDPLLTCRIPGGRSPVRILCDTRLRTPLTARVVATARQFPTLLATCCPDPDRRAAYEDAGCRVLVLPEREGHVDLNALMDELGRREIDSVLLEGGGSLNWSALEQGVVQKVLAYIAPKLAGGRDAKTPVEGLGIDRMARAILLNNSTITQIGTDFLIESEVGPCVHGDC